MEELLAKLKKNQGQGKANGVPEVSLQDVRKAVEKLSVLGGGFRLIKVAEKSEYVVSVPMELNTDHESLLEEAAHNEYIDEESFTVSHGWSQERFERVLTPLMHESMLWVDTTEEGWTCYMLPPMGE